MSAGVGRRDDLEAGDRHRPVLDRLGVLRAEPEPAAVRRAQHERQRDLAVGHVAGLRDLVRDHVPGHREEVAEHELGDRAQAGHRGAHDRPDDCLLADRRVADALRPEPVEESLRELEDPARRAHVLADEDDVRVALHLLGNRRGNRRAIRQLRHAEPPSAQTCVSMVAASASGDDRANGLALCDSRHRGFVDRRQRGLAAARGQDRGPSARDRILREPLLDFVVGAVLRRVGARMAAVAVRERLDERRPAARSRPLDRPGARPRRPRRRRCRRRPGAPARTRPRDRQPAAARP